MCITIWKACIKIKENGHFVYKIDFNKYICIENDKLVLFLTIVLFKLANICYPDLVFIFYS